MLMVFFVTIARSIKSFTVIMNDYKCVQQASSFRYFRELKTLIVKRYVS